MLIQSGTVFKAKVLSLKSLACVLLRRYAFFCRAVPASSQFVACRGSVGRGPGDLSVSIDAIGPQGADKLNAAIRTIIAATITHGKTSGIFCASPQAIGRWAAIGARFFVLASDTMFLGAGAAANAAAARDELA